MIYITNDPEYRFGLPASFITSNQQNNASFVPTFQMHCDYNKHNGISILEEQELNYHKYLDNFPRECFENLNNTILIMPKRKDKKDTFYYQWFLNYLELNNFKYKRLDKTQKTLHDYIKLPRQIIKTTIQTSLNTFLFLGY